MLHQTVYALATLLTLLFVAAAVCFALTV